MSTILVKSVLGRSKISKTWVMSWLPVQRVSFVLSMRNLFFIIILVWKLDWVCIKNCEVVENFVIIFEMIRCLNLKKVQAYHNWKKEEGMSQLELNKFKMFKVECRPVECEKAECCKHSYLYLPLLFLLSLWDRYN